MVFLPDLLYNHIVYVRLSPLMVLLLAMLPGTGDAQLVPMDHIAPVNNDLTSIQGFGVMQIFPDFPEFSGTVIEDFTSPGGTLTSVEVAFEKSSNNVVLSAIVGWRVSIWENKAFAAVSGNNLDQNTLATTVVSPQSVVLTALDGTTAVGPAYKAVIPVTLMVPPGRVYIGVAPILPFVTGNGQTFILKHNSPSVLGAQTPNDCFGVNPSEGFGVGNPVVVDANASYRVTFGTGGSGFLGTVVPNDYLVRLGRRTSGDLQSLRAIDNDPLKVCKFVVPNQGVAPIVVEVTGVSDLINVPRLVLRTRTRIPISGQFEQKVEFYDYQARSFDPDVRTIPLGQNYNSSAFGLPTPSFRFMSPTMAVRSRISFRQIGPSADPTWCAEIDAVLWDQYGF